VSVGGESSAEGIVIGGEPEGAEQGKDSVATSGRDPAGDTDNQEK
jgi:hypothetical protein